MHEKREAYIPLKYHKENFENNAKYRLINPAKKRLRKNKLTFGQGKLTFKDNFKGKPVEKHTKRNRMVWQHRGKN